MKKIDDIFNLNNKVIVITGATGLLGKKHAEAIAAFGGIPILIDLSEDAIESLSNILQKKYAVNAKGFCVDITNEVQVKETAQDIVNLYGKIDGLVNNVANNPKMESSNEKNFSRLENFPLNNWNQDINVGLTGAFLCVKYFGHKISENPNGGSIINISSDLGLIAPDQRLYSIDGLPDHLQPVKPVTYSVVKTGMIGLTRYIATYWSAENVRCNAICPGGVENGQPEDFIEEVSSRIPMARMASADEYQSTLVWMLSDASSYLNGAIVPVDGGRTSW